MAGNTSKRSDPAVPSEAVAESHDDALPAQSVAKALLIMEYIGLEGLTTIAKLSARVGMPKSTLHRLITTLVDMGFVNRTEHGQYRISYKLWRIGASAVNLESIRESLRLALTELVEKTSETAHYSVYEDGFSVYVDKVDGLHPIRAYTAVGGRSPAYATATGKALLAWQTKAEIERVAGRVERFTDNTLRDAMAVLAHMQSVRGLGYAVNAGEWREGVWGIACPVFDPAGHPIAALGISGPRDRFESRIDELAEIVKATAARLSQVNSIEPAPSRRRGGEAT
jgi:IclR family transcriptional regulator, KDG regulon repressor